MIAQCALHIVHVHPLIPIRKSGLIFFFYNTLYVHFVCCTMISFKQKTKDIESKTKSQSQLTPRSLSASPFVGSASEATCTEPIHIQSHILEPCRG